MVNAVTQQLAASATRYLSSRVLLEIRDMLPQGFTQPPQLRRPLVRPGTFQGHAKGQVHLSKFSHHIERIEKF